MSLLTKTPAADKSLTVERKRGATTPTSSSVNLLSPWVLDELRVRRLRRRFVFGAIALVVLLAAVWALLRFDVMRAQEDLRGDEAVTQGLVSQIGDLSDVKVYVDNVRVRSLSVETTMAKQIGFAAVFRQLDEALPEGTTLATAVVSLSGDAVAGAEATPSLCPGPDPFGSRPVIGCIELTGFADSRSDVTDLVQALGRSKRFIEPFITSTTVSDAAETGQGVDFGLSVGLSDTTYTNRFADVDGSDAPADEAADETADEAVTETEEGQR